MMKRTWKGTAPIITWCGRSSAEGNRTRTDARCEYLCVWRLVLDNSDRSIRHLGASRLLTRHQVEGKGQTVNDDKFLMKTNNRPIRNDHNPRLRGQRSCASSNWCSLLFEDDNDGQQMKTDEISPKKYIESFQLILDATFYLPTRLFNWNDWNRFLRTKVFVPFMPSSIIAPQ